MKNLVKHKHFRTILVLVIGTLLIVGGAIGGFMYVKGLNDTIATQNSHIKALNGQLALQKSELDVDKDKYSDLFNKYNTVNGNYLKLRQAVVEYVSKYNSSAQGLLCTSYTYGINNQITNTSCN